MLSKKSTETLGLHLLVCAVALTLTVGVSGCGSSGNDTSSSAAPKEEAEASAEEREADSIAGTTEDAAEPEAANEVAEEEAPQSNVVEAKLNETISTDEYDLTFTESYWDAADEEGSWVYMQGDNITRSMSMDPGTQVFVVRASVTSKAASAIQPAFNCRGEAHINGKYEYNVRATNVNGVYDVEPFETAEVLIYIEVPQAMKDQFEDIDIKWGFTVDDTYPQSLDDLYEVYDLYFK